MARSAMLPAMDSTSSRLSMTATWQPSAANSPAMARPMPLAPPTTRATSLDRFSSMANSQRVSVINPSFGIAKPAQSKESDRQLRLASERKISEDFAQDAREFESVPRQAR